jgi:hypothetical protein
MSYQTDILKRLKGEKAMKFNKISPYAKVRMRHRGISMGTLVHLLDHGQVENKSDGTQLVHLENDSPSPIQAKRREPRTLYALVDPAGEVITVEFRVRR